MFSILYSERKWLFMAWNYFKNDDIVFVCVRECKDAFTNDCFFVLWLNIFWYVNKATFLHKRDTLETKASDRCKKKRGWCGCTLCRCGCGMGVQYIQVFAPSNVYGMLTEQFISWFQIDKKQKIKQLFTRFRCKILFIVTFRSHLIFF